MIFALALAGGRSTRFGREKAVEPLGGEPMIGRVVRALSAGVERVAINAPPGSAAAAYALAHAHPVLADGEGGPSGPLAGVHAGLVWARDGGAAWLATSPCDTPLIPHDLVARLQGRRSPSGAVARTADGLHPLCALWPVHALKMIEALQDHPPVRDLLARLGAAAVDFEDAGAFANLNTPEEFAAVRVQAAAS